MIRVWFAILFCSSLLIPSSLRAESCEEAAKLVREGLSLSDSSDTEEEKYRSAVEKCPQMPEAYFNLGIVLDKKGDLAEAIENFEKARSIRESNEFKLAHAHTLAKTGDVETAREIYEELREDKASELDALIGLAHVQSIEGKLNDAAETLYKAKSLEPDNEDVLYNLAVLLERSNRLDESLVFYENVLSVNPSNQKALLRAGLVSLKLKEWNRGLRYLEKASEKDPKNVDILRAIGVSYERLGQYERAEVSLKRALTIDPTDVPTSVNLAIVLIKTKRESLAEEVLLEISEEQRNAKLYSALGWAQLELGKYKNAERSLKQALSKNPKDESARENLVTLYKRTGRDESVDSVLSELESDKPDKKISQAVELNQ